MVRGMSVLDPFYEFREQMVDRLVRDLVGPGAIDETIDDLPMEKYICGILYPRSEDPIDPAQDDDAAESDDESTFADPPVALANEKYPSSTGMTFAVDLARAQEVVVRTSAAMYAPEEDEKSRRWVRRALAIEPVTLRVDEPVSDKRVPLDDGLELFVRVRQAESSGAVAVTVALVNTRLAKPGLRDGDAFYQPSIVVQASDMAAVFVERDA